MNVYEFTEAIRRQRRLMIVGGLLLLLAVVAITFKVEDGSFAARIDPKFETKVAFAVVPSGAESIGTAEPDSANLEASALFYQTLLTAPDAADAIQSASGVIIQDFAVEVSKNTLTVTAVANSPEGAKSLGLGAFDWLTERLDDPVTMVNVTPTTAAPSFRNADGTIASQLVVDVSGGLSEDGEGLWLRLAPDGGDALTVSLQDAALEEVVVKSMSLDPEGKLAIQLEDAAENVLDSVVVALPLMPSADEAPQALVVRIDRGAVAGLPKAPASDEEGAASSRDFSEVALVAGRLDVSWQGSNSVFDEGTAPSPSAISLALLTDTPIALETGARRGPIITLGALLGGAFALVALAIAVDGWQQARVSQEAERYRHRLAVVRPIGGHPDYRGDGPLSEIINLSEDPPTRGRPGQSGH